nr:MAG TPA: helix-turn-helix domain protein [Caudoviricetes sp.]
MAARLTDKQKKKIVADYLECESYNATAKKNGVCGQTVRRVIEESQGITENLKRKKEENTADILAYMDSRRKQVCDIIEVGLAVLPEKIQTAKTASEVTTAIGTLIDKWALVKSEGEEGKVQVIIDV